MGFEPRQARKKIESRDPRITAFLLLQIVFLLKQLVSFGLLTKDSYWSGSCGIPKGCLILRKLVHFLIIQGDLGFSIKLQGDGYDIRQVSSSGFIPDV